MMHGNIISSTGTINTLDGTQSIKDANPFRYSGYFYDNETVFYYLKARYYTPYLQRFITRDTFIGINPYLYTGNNPVGRIDYDGKKWWNDIVNWLKKVTDKLKGSIKDVKDIDSYGHSDALGHRDDNYYLVNVGYDDFANLYTYSAELSGVKSIEDKTLTLGGNAGISVFDLEAATPKIGTSKVDLGFVGEGELLNAEGDLGLILGKNGIYGNASTMASVASGEIGIDFNVFGISIGLGGEGYFGAIGGGIKAGYSKGKGKQKNKASFGVKGAGGLGAGFYFDISW